jgi:hypothetical protein
MTGPAGLDINGSLYPEYHADGLEVLVIADSLPSMDLSYDNAQLYFAGVDFKWAIDPTQWATTWGSGVSTNGWMTVKLDTMEITNIQPGWDGTLVRSQIEGDMGL